MEPVWLQGITGSGVVVSIVDDGGLVASGNSIGRLTTPNQEDVNHTHHIVRV